MTQEDNHSQKRYVRVANSRRNDYSSQKYSRVSNRSYTKSTQLHCMSQSPPVNGVKIYHHKKSSAQDYLDSNNIDSPEHHSSASASKSNRKEKNLQRVSNLHSIIRKYEPDYLSSNIYLHDNAP